MAAVAKRASLIITILFLSSVVLLPYFSHVAWKEYLITQKFSSNAGARQGFSRSSARHNGGESTKNCSKNFFKNILLVVNYHSPFYDTFPLISSNYEGAFPNIIICGPSYSPLYDMIVGRKNARGFFAYECFGKAMRMHPGFEGYFFVNDDMIVNWWNFVKFDRNKIWAGAPFSDSKTSHKVGQRPIARTWNWWTMYDGAENCEKAHKEIRILANNNRSLRATTFKKMLSTFLQNANNVVYCFKGWSDIFYVPGRLSTDFQSLSEIFVRNGVFLEISVPTILSFLDLYENMEKAYGSYLPEIFGYGPDLVAGGHPWKVYSHNETLFIHPVKFKQSNAHLNRKNLKDIVVPYGRKFLQCQ